MVRALTRYEEEDARHRLHPDKTGTGRWITSRFHCFERVTRWPEPKGIKQTPAPTACVRTGGIGGKAKFSASGTGWCLSGQVPDASLTTPIASRGTARTLAGAEGQGCSTSPMSVMTSRTTTKSLESDARYRASRHRALVNTLHPPKCYARTSGTPEHRPWYRISDARSQARGQGVESAKNTVTSRPGGILVPLLLCSQLPHENGANEPSENGEGVHRTLGLAQNLKREPSEGSNEDDAAGNNEVH
jgi:hypothetical protein